MSPTVPFDSPAWFAGAIMAPPCLWTLFIKPHKCYSSRMAQRHLLSGGVWDWAGDIAVHGLFISLLLTGAGVGIGGGQKNSVSVSKSVKCDRGSSVLNMRQSLKSNGQLDGDPPSKRRASVPDLPSNRQVARCGYRAWRVMAKSH